ncbi:MAG: type II toxin-antitoxin system prevent-host-death family antitoxin [Planctomycetes bacterium]|nr:type II toxin-antitoxin system prevent-host-death family antitoxin [Planctomycetota bacterium]
MIVTEQELSSRMQSLLEDVQRGAEIVISRSGKPLARLLPLEKDNSPIRFGVLRGKAWVADDFDAPLPEAVLAAFEGRECGY